MPPALRQTFVSLAAHWRRRTADRWQIKKQQIVEKRIKLVDTRQPLPQIQKKTSRAGCRRGQLFGDCWTIFREEIQPKKQTSKAFGLP